LFFSRVTLLTVIVLDHQHRAASDPSTFGLGASGEPVHNPLQACLFGA